MIDFQKITLILITWLNYKKAPGALSLSHPPLYCHLRFISSFTVFLQLFEPRYLYFIPSSTPIHHVDNRPLSRIGKLVIPSSPFLPGPVWPPHPIYGIYTLHGTGNGSGSGKQWVTENDGELFTGIGYGIRHHLFSYKCFRSRSRPRSRFRVVWLSH